MTTSTKLRTGTFLAPGASKNRRLYTKENIGRAVERMTTRLSSGQTIPMHTSHMANAEGDTRATAAYVRKVWQDEGTGEGKLLLEYADTEAGRDTMAQRKDLRTISIFGNWVGDVRTDDDGFETADDLDVSSVDFTHRPGVGAAKLDESLSAEAAKAGAHIWESFDEAFVDETPAPAPATEDRPSWVALLAAEGQHHFDDGRCPQCEAAGVYTIDEAAKAPYGDVPYADPGYQADGKKRYPIDTKAHVRSAWAYINKATNAAKYTSKQVSAIKGKIKTAAKKLGIDISAEAELLATTLSELGAEFMDAVEAYASTCLDNGAANVRVDAWVNDPSDLPKVGAAVARAALAAVMNLDPDNDGDIDIPGGTEGADDDMESCTECGYESVPSDAMFCPQCGQPVPGAEQAPAVDKEGAMSVIVKAEAVKALLSTEQASKLDPAKTEYTQEEVAALLAPAPATETAKTPIELLAEALTGAAKAPVTETDDQRMDREAVERVAAIQAREAGAAVTKGELVEFGKVLASTITEAVKTTVIEDTRRGGGFTRRGLVEKATAMAGKTIESDQSELAKQSNDEFGATLLSALDDLLPQSA